MPTEDVALSVRKITRQGSRRIAKVAFDYAQRRRKSVTAVGKQHVLQMTDGLFMSEAYALAKAHPEVAFREMDIDAMAADLYRRPQRYDVILITNMFGDILSNEAAALSGGLGLAAALNAGDATPSPTPGMARRRISRARGIANPCGMILSSAMLLEWLGVRHGKAAVSRRLPRHPGRRGRGARRPQCQDRRSRRTRQQRRDLAKRSRVWCAKGIKRAHANKNPDRSTD